MKLSILIPVYNEEKTILLILNELNSLNIENISKEIIIVDDCSRDNTINIIEDYINNINTSINIKLIKHTINKGKGAAINSAIKYATGEIIIFQDADLEYDPKEYHKIINPIINGKADVVYGSRFIGGNPHRILFFWHTIGNKFLTMLSNIFTNLNLTDMETCYKAFKSDIIKNISIQENRFGIEPEITSKISKIKNIRIFEVGISYYGRTYEEGKKISWKDGFRAIYCIFKYNLFP
jgi:glycosyltransferase involved in cell wall biosynthesis